MLFTNSKMAFCSMFITPFDVSSTSGSSIATSSEKRAYLAARLGLFEPFEEVGSVIFQEDLVRLNLTSMWKESE